MSSEPHYLEKELDLLIQTEKTIWRFLRESSLDGVWYWDLERPENEYMSPEFWRLFGFDPDTKAHLAAEWQDLIYPEDFELAKQNLENHLADPDHPYDQVVRYKCADGSTAWVRCRGMAVRDETGKPIRLLGAHNDITQQKLEKSAAATARDELETVFHAATNGIIALTSEGEIVRINNKARHMLGGISDPTPFDWPQNIKFLRADTLQPLPDGTDPVRRALSGERLMYETHIISRLHPHDETRYVRIENALVDNANSNIHTVLIFDDISNEERNRQVVERRSRLDALGQLTGGIAHDFNNLLASQFYAVELAQKATDEDRRTKYLEVLTSSIQQGRALTSRLLSFARRQPGLASVKKTAETFDEFEKLVRPMVEALIDIDIVVDEPDLRHFCDQTQLETALMNLVLNSRDAILRSDTGDRIDIRARAVRSPSKELDSKQVRPNDEGLKTPEKDASYRYIEISVADNGLGMDEESLSRCTDPFFTTKDSNSGTGLGLAMVYGFVRQADGDLRIYSEKGVGTTVQMTLPRGTTEGTREEPRPVDEVKHGNGETILVVEDEPQLLLMITDVLEDFGYSVITATSGNDALDRVERGDAFDVLLTDVVMPGKIGGFDLARRIRDLRTDMPVIYVSGYAGFTALEMGAVQAPLLQKPCSPLELANAIADALHRKATAK